MGNLESVLNDFYSCLDIPIVFYDAKWNLNLIKGHCDKSRDLLINLNVLESCKNDKSRYLEISNDNIHFFKFNLLINEYVNGYFIIGPFRSSKAFGLEEIIFKPYTCIRYIKNLLNSLIKDRFTYTDKFSSYVSKSIKYIHTNYYKDICIDDVCDVIGLNKSYFCSLFKKETGVTFCNFLNKFRIEMSKKFLCNRDYSILDVSLSVGYNNHNYYTQLFKKLNNITPLEFRNKKLKK